MGIAGASGAGKTTLIREHVSQVPNAAAVHFDNYEAFTNGPDSMEQWLADGVNYDAWSSDRLESDLRKLKEGGSIRHPKSGAEQGPVSKILFDAPFGYANRRLGASIDFTVFLDVPLDIAMARRLIRDTDNSEKTDLAMEMQNYLAYGRACYLAMNETVKQSCDLIVDAAYTVDKIASEILSKVCPQTPETER